MVSARLRDAIVVGAGPGGAMAAAGLARLGLDVIVLERERLPRVKPCGGWVTWGALRAAGLEPGTYPGTIQPFRGAVVAGRGDGELRATLYEEPASFGIVRSEFDRHLADAAAAAGAEVRDGVHVAAIRTLRSHGGPGGRSPLLEVVTAGGSFVTPLLVGAGGHFCPVARWLLGSGRGRGDLVLCQELEQRVGVEKLVGATPHYGLPELYPEPDYGGYGWYVTKGPYLNIGIGRLREHEGLPIKRALARFVLRLQALGRLEGISLERPVGHAYRVHDATPRRLVAGGVMLVGDAGGLAENYSGEGIRPALESGTQAARHGGRAIAQGDLSEAALAAYEVQLAGPGNARGAATVEAAAAYVPALARHALLDGILASDALRRRLVVEGLFRFEEPAAHAWRGREEPPPASEARA